MTTSDKAAKLFSGLDPIWGETSHAISRDRLFFFFFTQHLLSGFAFSMILNALNSNGKEARRRRNPCVVETRGLEIKPASIGLAQANFAHPLDTHAARGVGPWNNPGVSMIQTDETDESCHHPRDDIVNEPRQAKRVSGGIWS